MIYYFITRKMRYKKHSYILYFADNSWYGITYFNCADRNLSYTFSNKNIYIFLLIIIVRYEFNFLRHVRLYSIKELIIIATFK